MTERSEDPREALRRLQQRADDAYGEADYVTVSVADLRAALAQAAPLREAAQAVVLAFGPHRHSLMFEDDEIIALNRALAGPPSLVQVQGDTAGGGTPLDDDYEDGTMTGPTDPTLRAAVEEYLSDKDPGWDKLYGRKRLRAALRSPDTETER